MPERAAIDAQVVDIQNDRLHKGFIKVTVHVAAERGPLLTEILGWPTYTNPVPIAMAHLDLTVPQQPKENSQAPLMTAQAPASVTGELPARVNRYAQRAGILCNDPRFQGFLLERYGGGLKIADPVERREWAAETVREVCRVETRADILPNTPAAVRFDLLESSYLAENK